jgi:hypothetical protein
VTPKCVLLPPEQDTLEFRLGPPHMKCYGSWGRVAVESRQMRPRRLQIFEGCLTFQYQQAICAIQFT